MKPWNIATKDQFPLSKIRVERGLHIKDIAKQLGVTAMSVSNWCGGRHFPSLSYLDKLAEILGVSPEYIRELYQVKSDYVTVGNRPAIDTFWTKKRTDAGFSIIEVTELLNNSKDKTTVAKYFTGEIMPKDGTIRILCDAFDVDFALGKAEFEKAYKVWRGRHKGSTESPIEERSMKNIENTPATDIPKEDICISDNEDQVRNVGEMIYGSVDYEEFIAILKAAKSATKDSSLPKLVYGKVDFKTFNTIWGLFGE